MSMFSKLKNTINKISEEQFQQIPKKKIDISVLNNEQVKIYKNLFQKIRENIISLEQISNQNKQQLINYIKQRKELAADKDKQQSGDDNSSQIYTFEDDMKQMKQLLHEVNKQLLQVDTIHKEIKDKVGTIQNQQTVMTPQQQNAIENMMKELNTFKKSQENNKQILTTLTQQNQLYSKQIRQITEKSGKVEKQLNQCRKIITNLKEQKTLLLEMRNNDTASQIPQVEALRGQVSEYDKRLTFQKTKTQQKQKQIESLKKKLEEDRESLEKIADELKDKELKSKKILDKYQRSKTEVRKFREEKTDFIKQLNIEIAKLSGELSEQKAANDTLKKKIKENQVLIEQLNSQIQKNHHRKSELEYCNTELLEIRNQLHEKNVALQQNKKEQQKLQEENTLLQSKRKQLLQALEQPVKHQIRTLQKILRALDKLYKQYITVVFQEGNIVGFESKIMYIVSNVQQIKEDLAL